MSVFNERKKKYFEWLMLLLALVSLFYLQSLMSSTLKTSGSIYRILSYSAMLAWVVFALIGTGEQIKEWLSLLWPGLVCFLVAATLYLIRSNDNYLAARTKNILFFAFFAVVFLYYSRPGYEKFRATILAVWLLETVISCVHSIIFLQKYPDYARALVSPEMYGVYDGLQTYTMIAFYHVCCLSFLTPAFLYKALGKHRKSGFESLILLVCCLLFWFTVMKTQFTIALILVSSGILVVLMIVILEKSKKEARLPISILLMILIALLFLLLPKFLLSMYESNLFGSVLSDRVYSIYRMTAGLDIGNSDLLDRLYHYSLTLEGIRDSKLLGGYFTGSATYGGHSEFGDMLALFGVFFFALFIRFVINIFRIGYKYTGRDLRPGFIISYVIYFIFSLINTSLWTPIGIGLFIILPFSLHEGDLFPLIRRNVQ